MLAKGSEEVAVMAWRRVQTWVARERVKGWAVTATQGENKETKEGGVIEVVSFTARCAERQVK